MLLNSKEVYVCGDVHGKFRELFYNISRYRIHDSSIIIAGDVGLGFNKLRYYDNEFSYLYNRYKDLNNTVYAVRGNHDDPDYYKISISWGILTTVPDYSVLKWNDNNILCIGGALSIDKSYRLSDDRRTGRTSWWKNETPIYDYDKLDECSRLDNLSIVTHCSPSIFPPNGEGTGVSLDRMIMDNILSEVKDYNIKTWYYGHYHQSSSFIYNNFEAIGLNELEIVKF